MSVFPHPLRVDNWSKTDLTIGEACEKFVTTTDDWVETKNVDDKLAHLIQQEIERNIINAGLEVPVFVPSVQPKKTFKKIR
jgi:hypothetical protein